MTFHEPYLALLREFEGFFAKPYLCPAGVCTIGYGTNLEAHRRFIPYEDLRSSKVKGKALRDALLARGMVWSRDQAEEAMKWELVNTDAQLKKCCPAYNILLNKGEAVRADCVLDMGYNMGVSTLMTFRKSLPMLEKGEYAKAADNFALSKWYRQVGRRSRAICKMIRTGNYVKPEELV